MPLTAPRASRAVQTLVDAYYDNEGHLPEDMADPPLMQDVCPLRTELGRWYTGGVEEAPSAAVR